MAASYPTTAKTFQQLTAVDHCFGAQVNAPYDEVEAIEASLIGNVPYPAFSASIAGVFLSLPELRAYWPMSSFRPDPANGYIPSPADLSGQQRDLRQGSVAQPSRSTVSGLTPYVSLTGAPTPTWYERAHEAGISITGALTLLGWFYCIDNATPISLMSKAEVGVPNVYSFRLLCYRTIFPLHAFKFQISGNGTAWIESPASNTAQQNQVWQFVAARFVPSQSVSIALGVGDAVVIASTAAGIPAALASNTVRLCVNAHRTSGGFDGTGLANYSSWAICAAGLSDACLQRVYHRSRLAYGV